jgi:hypothetical protein
LWLCRSSRAKADATSLLVAKAALALVVVAAAIAAEQLE